MPRLPKYFRRRKDTGSIEVVKRVGGKLHRKSFGMDASEAIRKGNLWLYSLRLPSIAKSSDVLSFDEAAERWYKEKAIIARCEKAASAAKNRLLRSASPVIGSKGLSELKTSDLWAVRAFADKKLGLAEETVASSLRDVRCVLKYFKEWDRLYEKGLIPNPEVPPPDRLMDPDLALVIGSAGQWEPWVRLSVLTGIRWGELRDLEWRRVAEVPRRHLVLTRTKNKKVRRVPLCEEAWGILQAERERSSSFCVFRPS